MSMTEPEIPPSPSLPIGSTVVEADWMMAFQRHLRVLGVQVDAVAMRDMAAEIYSTRGGRGPKDGRAD